MKTAKIFIIIAVAFIIIFLGCEDPYVPDLESPDMVHITGGTFDMGDWLPQFELPLRIADENIKDMTANLEHGMDFTFDARLDELTGGIPTVTVDDFYLCKYEVTFDEFDRFCFEVKGYLNWDGFAGDEDYHPVSWGRVDRPAIYVDWLSAIEYCNWLSWKEGLDPCYTIDGITVRWDRTANGYRLPTEAEWEYAARGGVNIGSINGGYGYLYSGSDETRSAEDDYITIDEAAGLYEDLKPYAWFNLTSGWHDIDWPANDNGKSQLVGTKIPNILGLYDMAGNAWEWCWDWYSPNWYQTMVDHPDLLNNPTGPDSSNRMGDWEIQKAHVMRGGSWGNWPIFLRTTFRFFSKKEAETCKYNPSYRYGNWRTGFRLARNYTP
jgi:sulfatase modifying factor 1